MSIEIATAVLTNAAPVVAKAAWQALREGLTARGVRQVPEKATPETIVLVQAEAKALPKMEERDLTLEAIARAHDAPTV